MQIRPSWCWSGSNELIHISCFLCIEVWFWYHTESLKNFHFLYVNNWPADICLLSRWFGWEYSYKSIDNNMQTFSRLEASGLYFNTTLAISLAKIIYRLCIGFKWVNYHRRRIWGSDRPHAKFKKPRVSPQKI